MKKILLISLGSLFLGIGVLGIFIPLLPTVPFFLLTASCYVKSSDNLYRWLLSHKYFGKIINDYRMYKSISLKTKIISLSLLWASISVSAFVMISNHWIRLLLLAIAVGVSIHILSYKSRRE